MDRQRLLERSLAGVTAIAAAAGLALYAVKEAARRDGDWLVAVWTNAGFLTDLTNLLLAVVMASVALGLGPLRRPGFATGAVAAILMVGIGFWLVGGRLAIGKSALEDILLHGVTPWLALAAWLVLRPKGELRWLHLPVWSAVFVAYWTYALVRGGLTGDYAYPFLNPAQGGWSAVLIVVALLVALFVVIATALIGLDRLMGRRRA